MNPVTQISRRFINVAGRRVHYRKAGSGPPLLLVHKSLASSAIYEGLMADWGRHFTCIAPDTPGYGYSEALDGAACSADVRMDQFSDWLIDFVAALGLERVGAYGFHSGGAILLNAVRRRPDRFAAAVVGGYAVWTDVERQQFGDRYLPPFEPRPFGEHLTWLWSRLLEHTWFFPWFDPRNDNRQAIAHDDIKRVAAAVNGLLDSGAAYRDAYGATLFSRSRIPAPHEQSAPVMIVASRDDMLETHMSRLPTLPASWSAVSVDMPSQALETAREFIAANPGDVVVELRADDQEGFVHVTVAGFDGLIRWRGDRKRDRVWLHAPGRSLDLLDVGDDLAIDLPGHGLSDDFQGEALADWVEVVSVVLGAVARQPVRTVVGEGVSALLALGVGARLGVRVEAVAAHVPQPEAGETWLNVWPSVGPDRFGAYLSNAWQIARSSHFFWPWFVASEATAIPFAPADIEPARLAIEHRALLRAGGGRALLSALLSADRAALIAGARISDWQTAEWARDRKDVWRP